MTKLRKRAEKLATKILICRHAVEFENILKEKLRVLLEVDIDGIK